ncbi:MAG: tyrosine-protein phosphatase [Opitutaceae bacterium]
MKRFRHIAPGILCGSLPLAREIVAMVAEHGLRSVVDLTQRPRPTVRRACERAGISYIKRPLPYEGGDISGAARAAGAAPRPVFFHCFHGRDRTGAVASALCAA